MSTPPPQPVRKSGGDSKKVTPPPSSIVTRNGARKAKIQTRAMSAGAKPSASLLAAKKKAQQKKKTTIQTELKDPYQVAMDSKNKIKGPTGFVTEPRMAEHRCLWDDNYPECPERLIRVIDRCEELNLIKQCKQYPPRAVTKEELSMLHSPSVYDMLETTHNNHDLEYLERLSSKYDAIYIHPSTHELALLAAGSTIDMVDRIVSGSVCNGACFVRPPGHHAMEAEPCGYCFYNNVALAARHAIDKRGLNRVLIVDWDVHHGQGTQQMFYDDPRVLYFSIHRYEHGSFWPNLRQSDFHYVGSGAGSGFTCNVPLNKTGMKDGDYLAIWHQLLLPMAFEFSPELVIVSAGFDSALGDEKGEMELTPAVYGSLLQLLSAVCPAICVVLEGGYCLPSLAEGAAHTLRALLGHAPAYRHEYTEPSDEIAETILNCIYVQKRHWSCFNYQPTYNTTGPPNVCDGEKQKHTVVVKWEGDETRPESYATRDCYPLQDDETKRRIARRLDHLRIVTDLTLPKHAVGYIYDQAMLKHRNICEPGHPECPERILRIHERHRDFGLLERVYHLTPRLATDHEILTVHSTEHLDRLKELSTTKLRDLNSQKNSFDSVYFHPDSLESAAMAAGCVIEAVESVTSGTCGSAVCIVRPPGHHADDSTPSGFCLLNSAALGARHALAMCGLKRVLLLDWDVHHGNGTQRITYDDRGILYMSLHRYEDASFFPHSKEANYTAVGGGKAEGYNVNIPWNKRGMGDAEYLAAFTQIVLPIAFEYNPELVIVSAGFDACVGDPLGGCKVSPECYGRMTTLLRSLAGGRLVLCLEGGYNITSISYAMTMCTKALLGDPIAYSHDQKLTPHWSAVETINNVIKTHKKYWKSLKFQVALPAEDVIGPPLPSRGLKDVKTESSSSELSLENQMANMNIGKDNVSLAKDNIGSAKDNMSTDKDNISIGKGDMSIGKDNFSLARDNNGLAEDNNNIGKDNTSIDKKCSDGIHCGTDDEDESPQKNDPGCSVGTSGSSKQNNKQGSSNTKDGEGSSAMSQASGSSKKQTNSVSNSNQENPTTLVDYLASNMQAIVEGEMFAVIPLAWCPHLDTLYALPPSVAFEQGVKCVACDETRENWVCLHCYITACGRSINGHMQAHYASTGHPLVLSLLDLSVWCNVCDAYVDNALLYDAKNNAHRCKFGEDMPWCYNTDTIHMG